MKFEEAIVELRKGKSIKRKCFEKYISKKSPMDISILLIDIINDLHDWEIAEEPGKSFPEVFEAFKEGKSIRRKSWPGSSWINMYGIRNEYIRENIVTDLLEKDWEVIE